MSKMPSNYSTAMHEEGDTFKSQINEMQSELKDAKNEVKSQRKSKRYIGRANVKMGALTDSTLEKSNYACQMLNDFEVSGDIGQLKSSIISLNFKVEWLTQTNQQLQEKLYGKEAERNALSSKIFDLKNEVTQKEKENINLKETVGLLQTRVLDLTQTMKMASTKMTALKKKVNVLSNEIESYMVDDEPHGFNRKEPTLGYYHKFITQFFDNINTTSGFPLFVLNNILTPEGINDYQYQVTALVRSKQELDLRFSSISKELETALSDNESLGELIQRQVNQRIELEHLLEDEKATNQSLFSQITNLQSYVDKDSETGVKPTTSEEHNSMREAMLTLLADNMTLISLIERLKDGLSENQMSIMQSQSEFGESAVADLHLPSTLNDVIIECEKITPEYLSIRLSAASKDSIDVLDKIKANLESNKSCLLEQLGCSSSVIKKLQDEIVKNKKVILEQEEIIKLEREKCEAISNLKSQCETALLKNMNEGHMMQQKMREVLDQVISLQNSNSALDGRIVILMEEKATLESENKDLSVNVKELSLQKSEVEVKLHKMEEELQEKSKLVSKLEMMMAEVWSRNYQLTPEKSSLAESPQAQSSGEDSQRDVNKKDGKRSKGYNDRPMRHTWEIKSSTPTSF